MIYVILILLVIIIVLLLHIQAQDRSIRNHKKSIEALNDFGRYQRECIENLQNEVKGSQTDLRCMDVRETQKACDHLADLGRLHHAIRIGKTRKIKIGLIKAAIADIVGFQDKYKHQDKTGMPQPYFVMIRHNIKENKKQLRKLRKELKNA